jgi:metal-responsive CopG/Arc/MetJ family transcriptional regulator
MDIREIKELLANKDVLINMRINSRLLNLFDDTLKSDLKFKSRSDFVNDAILRYLEEKGVFK